MDLAYERRGSGPPLVLIHGIGHHWQAWLPVLDILAQSRDVIAVDLPGFGASPPLPARTPYNPSTLAEALLGFFGAVGVERPHVAGNSLGGYLSLELAARGLASSATALSPAGFWTAGELVYARGVLMALRTATTVMPAAQASLLASSPLGRAAAFSLIVARPAQLTPAAVEASMAALRDCAGFDETLESFAAISPPARPKVPVTIAWGDRDRLLFRRQGARAARWLGQPTVRLRGCGHVPMSDDPELVARVLLQGSS